MRASGRSTLLITRIDRQVRLERLAQHEAGLGQRALGGVDEQQHAVDHRQAPLDLAAEVGVAGGVDDVDLHAAVADRGVLGEDRDALLALEVVRVHDPLGHVLVGAEDAGLPEHGVDQRGLAVVDVGDDGDVAQVVAAARADIELSGEGKPPSYRLEPRLPDSRRPCGLSPWCACPDPPRPPHQRDLQWQAEEREHELRRRVRAPVDRHLHVRGEHHDEEARRERRRRAPGPRDGDAGGQQQLHCTAHEGPGARQNRAGPPARCRRNRPGRRSGRYRRRRATPKAPARRGRTSRAPADRPGRIADRTVDGRVAVGRRAGDHPRPDQRSRSDDVSERGTPDVGLHRGLLHPRGVRPESRSESRR